MARLHRWVRSLSAYILLLTWDVVFPDWIGAALNGSGAVDWWINEFILWSKLVAVCYPVLYSRLLLLMFAKVVLIPVV